MELSYACVGRQAPYSFLGSHCPQPRAIHRALPLSKTSAHASILAWPWKAVLSNQEIHVPKLLLPMIGILTMALACGCNSAKSPAAVATDVAAARQQASTEVTDARTDAAKNVDGAAANADGAYDVAVAQADGDHNVAIQQCLALTGEAQKSCKERADAAYDQAKTHANVSRLSKLQ
jgi:hypothetical protein